MNKKTVLQSNVKRKRYILAVFFLVIVLIAAFYFQFTKEGYRMTIAWRNFEEIVPNVYLHKGYEAPVDEILTTVESARIRVADFFGEVRSNPVIIICNDEKILQKLGGDHDTSTVVFFGAYSYISLSSEYFNIDILAHELTHAEVHSRLYKGKIGTKSLVPLWFDEGLALQNDYRPAYNQAAWAAATENGSKIVEMDKISTAAEFYSGTAKDRRYRYIVSRHEVGQWLEKNDVDQLIELLDAVNQYDNFDEMYSGSYGY